MSCEGTMYRKDLKLLAKEIDRWITFYGDNELKYRLRSQDANDNQFTRDCHRNTARIFQVKKETCEQIKKEMKEIFEDDKEEIWGSGPTCENTGTTSSGCATV